MSSLFKELERRRVLKVAAVYIAVAWGATEMLGFLLPALNFPRWTITIVALLFILGFPVAMFLSWVFDLRPDGVRRASPSSSRGTLTIVVAVCFLAAGTTGLFYLIYPEIPPSAESRAKDTFDPPDNSVAVLPFVNMSDDPENTYFGDGIAEELLHRLARNTGLLVTARTSSFQFRDKLLDVREIGEQLNVAKILEGSIRKSDTRIRITVQLINTLDGYHDWSETYDRELTDIFAIQEEIAVSVGDALATKMVVASRAGPAVTGMDTISDDLEAYEMHLRARHLLMNGEDADIEESIRILEDLVSSHPDYAQAWLSLAEARSTAPGRDENSDILIGEAATTALTLDPTLGPAHALIARLAMRRWQWLEAESRFRKGLALDPGNIDIAREYASFLMTIGRIEEAHDRLRQVFARDPLSVSTRIEVAKILLMKGEADAALQYVRSMPVAETLSIRARQIIVHALLREHRYDDVRSLTTQWRQAGETAPWFWPPFVITAVADQNERESASGRLRLMASLEQLPVEFELVYQAWLMQWDAAYRSSEICVERKTCLLEETWQPELSDFRRDSRFAEFASAAGLAGYWNEHGHPDSCSRVNGEVACL